MNINLENLASKGKLNIVVDRTEEAKENSKKLTHIHSVKKIAPALNKYAELKIVPTLKPKLMKLEDRRRTEVADVSLESGGSNDD